MWKGKKKKKRHSNKKFGAKGDFLFTCMLFWKDYRYHSFHLM